MHSLLIIHPSQHDQHLQEPHDSPETVLRSCGYITTLAANQEEACQLIKEADASILYLPITDINPWTTLLMQQKTTPILWWCSKHTASISSAACDDDIMVDGVISPSMLSHEIHWSLHFSSKQCLERQLWLKERAQLLSRIEERKWIDMAKGILSKSKNISESEAYELLRKQAMNERKRMVDVATSIVKVYQLLQDQT